jgi:quinol monooxygenase YgiN
LTVIFDLSSKYKEAVFSQFHRFNLGEVDQSMEILQITIHARDDKRKELLRACRLITDQTRQESGCKSSQFSQDNDNKNIITLEQQWEERSSLDNYFRSDHFSALFGAMKLLGRNYEIRINGGNQKEGRRDAVKRARGI